MRQITSPSGETIGGMFRGLNGEIVVQDPEAFNKYQIQKAINESQRRKIDELTEKVDQLTDLVQKFIQENK